MRRTDLAAAIPSGFRRISQRVMFVIAKCLKKSRLSAISNSEIHPTSKVESGTTFHCSVMEKYSFCGYDCDISHADIASFVSIANGVVIGGGRHPMEWVGMSPVFYEGRDSVTKKFAIHSRQAPQRVVVGHDVWIGRSAIVLPGVHIGDGAVVGAGSVVTAPVPPYAIIAGSPARILRYRFSESVIARLLSIRWWSMDEDKLLQLGPYFNDVGKFLEIVEKSE